MACDCACGSATADDVGGAGRPLDVGVKPGDGDDDTGNDCDEPRSPAFGMWLSWLFCVGGSGTRALGA